MKRLLVAVSASVVVTLATPAQTNPEFQRTEDVIYGRKYGTALTLDVFRPAKPNQAGIIFVVSGGWFSSHDSINLHLMRLFLDRGYTVFAVVHGSQPKFQITEAIQDMHRAVRFIRLHARDYGVDPQRFGVTGASAGGHLSLIIGTQGGPGKADAKDPVDRESSAVQAVGCFFPPTDFLNYGAPGEDAVGVGVLANYKPAFGPRADTAEGRQTLAKEIAPIDYITAKLPPTLIIHGDADKLVPLQQSESFAKRAQEVGVSVKLIVRPGVAHGWKDMTPDWIAIADWFDQQLGQK